MTSKGNVCDEHATPKEEPDEGESLGLLGNRFRIDMRGLFRVRLRHRRARHGSNYARKRHIRYREHHRRRDCLAPQLSSPTTHTERYDTYRVRFIPNSDGVQFLSRRTQWKLKIPERVARERCPVKITPAVRSTTTRPSTT